MKKTAAFIASFAIATVVVCIANFILQIVLWIVTGVFGAVFTIGAAEQLAGKEREIDAQAGNVVLVVSLLAIAFAVFFLSRGLFRRDPKEFSLLFSNGYVFISYFAGAAAMSLILRKLDQ